VDMATVRVNYRFGGPATARYWYLPLMFFDGKAGLAPAFLFKRGDDPPGFPINCW